MGNKGAPAAGDYAGAASATGASGQANINSQTQNNRPDQSNPFASSNWTDGPNGWQQTSTFAGPLGEANSGWEQQAASAANTPLDTGTQARDQAITGAYDQATSRLDPQFAQMGEQQQQQLANEGADPGSMAASVSNQNFGRQENDAYSQAMYDAIGQGTQAQQATFGENLAAQDNPLQELGQEQGLLGQAGFSQAGLAAPTNYLGAQEALGNYNLGSSQANNQFWGDALSALGSAGGAAGGLAVLSDERVKSHVLRSKTKQAMPGVPEATFEYKDAPGKKFKGVIAQDVEKVAPHMVGRGPGGVKTVHPALAPFRL